MIQGTDSTVAPATTNTSSGVYSSLPVSVSPAQPISSAAIPASTSPIYANGAPSSAGGTKPPRLPTSIIVNSLTNPGVPTIYGTQTEFLADAQDLLGLSLSLKSFNRELFANRGLFHTPNGTFFISYQDLNDGAKVSSTSEPESFSL